MTDAVGGETTGRYLVLLEDDSDVEGARAISRVAGLRTVSTAEMAGASAASLLGEADGLLLHELGVAILTAGADQAEALTREAEGTGPLSMVEAERRVYAIEALDSTEAAPAVDESTLTWGLQAVGAAGRRAGHRIRSQPSRLRRPRGGDQFVRRGAAAARRARTRHTLHRHLVRAT